MEKVEGEKELPSGERYKPEGRMGPIEAASPSPCSLSSKLEAAKGRRGVGKTAKGRC